MQLIMQNNPPLNEVFILVLMIGGGFFFISIMSMLLLFGWTIKDASKNIRGLTVMLLLSLLIPFGSLQLYKSIKSTTASSQIVFDSLEVANIDDTTTLVQFKTSEPSLVYIETKDRHTDEIIPILSTSTYEKQNVHSFTVPRGIKGKEIVFIINGERYSLRNKPFIIK